MVIFRASIMVVSCPTFKHYFFLSSPCRPSPKLNTLDTQGIPRIGLRVGLAGIRYRRCSCRIDIPRVLDLDKTKTSLGIIVLEIVHLRRTDVLFIGKVIVVPRTRHHWGYGWVSNVVNDLETRATTSLVQQVVKITRGRPLASVRIPFPDQMVLIWEWRNLLWWSIVSRHR